jgi:hypothetical protein
MPKKLEQLAEIEEILAAAARAYASEYQLDPKSMRSILAQRALNRAARAYTNALIRASD